jgi:inner membrane transporter RhtA
MIQTAMSPAQAPNPEGGRGISRALAWQAVGRLPPPALLLLAILSVQLGSALATLLFADLGPAGTTFASTVFSATVLSLMSPPRVDRRLLHGAPLVLAFGLIDACMALPFFLALQYLPLGIVATISFLGPLGLAVATSRRLSHFLWITIAALGIALLTPVVGSSLDPRGLALAGLSALAWAGFVLISKRLGRAFDGGDGLTFGMWAASVLLLPFALLEGRMFHAGVLGLAGAFAVALLGAVLPMALEFRALQRMSARTYGILVTVEPAIGALVGAAFLGQAIGTRSLIAIACVTIAALGITCFDRSGEG